ncbi:Fanconi anemia core complex-associated protein 100 isoform X2 [Protopterus annectens]|uniref:Fanconi anemia core complex-associated protein 100 isoform X2 n=1 Tax=Protopterus annectens TaxID=7888 RepID=UPI001CFAF73C|nr:Fanconi anemia core complex-associated protein 100 isoform X2 [Protopterus annectens]
MGVVSVRTESFECFGAGSVTISRLYTQLSYSSFSLFHYLAVYRFPNVVWRLELKPNCNHLYTLCASDGIYCVSLNPEKRLIREADSEAEGAFVPVVIPIDLTCCVVKDSDITAFIIVDETIVAVAKVQHSWRIKFFKRSDLEATQKYERYDDVEISIVQRTRPVSLSSGTDDNDELLPVLYCVYPPAANILTESCHSNERAILETSLFSLLFGVDATMLRTPVILCGFPDGQFCCLPLKRHSSSVMSYGPSEVSNCKTCVVVLHQLEQPVIFIQAQRTNQHVQETDERAQNEAGVNCNCIVIVGHHGRMVVIKASNKSEMQVPDFRQYHLGQSPILCGCCVGSYLYYSTSSELCMLELVCQKDSQDSEDSIQSGDLPLSLFPASLNICSVVNLTVSSITSEGDTEFVALSTAGRLMVCRLPRCPDKGRCDTLTAVKASQKIKELLSGIGSVSDRATSVSKTIQQKNKALAHLNQVLNVISLVLSSQKSLGEGEQQCRQPIGCCVSTKWNRLLRQDSLIICCSLENFSGFTLEEGWTLSIQLLTGSDSTSMAATSSFPVNKLISGSKMEVTVPLHFGKNGQLTLPVKVQCILFYSFTEILEKHNLPATESQILNGEGTCIILNEYNIDLLHCLHLSCSTVSETAVPDYGFPAHPVEVFLKSSQNLLGQNSKTADKTQVYGPDSTIERNPVGPFVASIKVSCNLLEDVLKDCSSGSNPNCVVLLWLMSDNAEVETVKALKVPVVCGTTPDRSNVRLLAKKVSLMDLCFEGPISAFEIHLECASLSALCHLHCAIIGRIRNILKHRDTHCSPLPNVRVQHLQELQNQNEILLKKVQALRDHLCLGMVTSSSETTEKLLMIYQEIRNFNLVIL